jgi:hypothetical protein
MNRLSLEQHRLFIAPMPEPGDGLGPRSHQARALVLELARPADWAALARVWHGVQVELELPAPAIAVNGRDGFQLWFSLAEPVDAAQAHAFLDALRRRWLADITPQRLRLLTHRAGDVSMAQLAERVPAQQAGSGLWSAFVTADLAPVLAGEPWLDLPPTPEAQASLLARLRPTPPADFERALRQLTAPPPAAMEVAPAAAATLGAAAPASPADAAPVPPDAGRLYTWTPAAGMPVDARQFLLDVMADNAVALPQRIEAAKALLGVQTP